MKRYLLIDDIRTPNMVMPGIVDQQAGPSFVLDVARSYEQGLAFIDRSLRYGIQYDVLFLDHDLGSEEELNNGYQLIKRALDMCFDHQGNLIKDRLDNMPVSMECVSDNGPGRANIISIFKTIEELRNAT